MKWLVVALVAAFVVANWRLGRMRRLRVPKDDPELARAVRSIEEADERERRISRYAKTSNPDDIVAFFGFTGHDPRAHRRPSTWFAATAVLVLFLWPMASGAELALIELIVLTMALSTRSAEARAIERARSED